MAYTTIDDPTLYFSTTLYTGDGNQNRAVTIDGTGMEPDWLWVKNRSAAEGHVVGDSVRGATKRLIPNSNEAEATRPTNIASFTSTGFTVANGGVDGAVNTNNATYVSWSWKETATAGFDIVSFTGSGSQRTVSHNLGVKPSMIIVKNRSATENWIVYDKINGAGKFMALNLTSASAASSSMFGVEPTTSVFTVGTSNATNKSSSNMIAYCFAEKQGYSKIGSYTGNGNADGPMIYLGFKPAFLIIKPSSKAEEWMVMDAKRDPENAVDSNLYANQNYSEADYDRLDIVSNGFKVRTDSGHLNTSGATMIYMAFAENPFVTSTGIPATAR